jgi:hypothetical protein
MNSLFIAFTPISGMTAMGEASGGDNNEPRACRALPELAQKARKIKNIALGGEQQCTHALRRHLRLNRCESRRKFITTKTP